MIKVLFRYLGILFLKNSKRSKKYVHLEISLLDLTSKLFNIIEFSQITKTLNVGLLDIMSTSVLLKSFCQKSSIVYSCLDVKS